MKQSKKTYSYKAEALKMWATPRSLFEAGTAIQALTVDSEEGKKTMRKQNQEYIGNLLGEIARDATKAERHWEKGRYVSAENALRIIFNNVRTITRVIEEAELETKVKAILLLPPEAAMHQLRILIKDNPYVVTRGDVMDWIGRHVEMVRGACEKAEREA